MKELELVGDHWRDNLPGETFSDRLKSAMMRRHMEELWNEAFNKRIKGIHEAASVVVTNPKNKILDLGFNDAKDLILDNFGNWFAALIRTPVNADLILSLNDIAPSAQNVYIWQNGTARTGWCFANSALGTQLQVGSGNTAALRTNTNIQTAFGTAPESGRFGTGPGAYGGGTVSFTGTISAGGAGTIAEAGFFGAWINTAGTAKYFMLFHDILLSTVSFVAGNSIFVNYSIVM